MLLAALGLNPERVAQFIVNVLAVGGGYLVGYFLFGFIAWGLDRWLLYGNTPIGLKRVIRHLGGVALAVLVALIVFGQGHGWNLFGGGGTGDGNGTSTSEGTGTGTGSAATVKETTPQTPVPPPVKETPTPTERIRITVLGGTDVKEMKFYLVDDERTPRTLGELEAVVASRRTADGKPIGIELRYSPQGGVGKDAPGTIRLVNWAQRAGLTVILPGDSR